MNIPKVGKVSNPPLSLAVSDGFDDRRFLFPVENEPNSHAGDPVSISVNVMQISVLLCFYIRTIALGFTQMKNILAVINPGVGRYSEWNNPRQLLSSMHAHPRCISPIPRLRAGSVSGSKNRLALGNIFQTKFFPGNNLMHEICNAIKIITLKVSACFINYISQL